jgi:hypothetical protein
LVAVVSITERFSKIGFIVLILLLYLIDIILLIYNILKYLIKLVYKLSIALSIILASILKRIGVQGDSCSSADLNSWLVFLQLLKEIGNI